MIQEVNMPHHCIVIAFICIVSTYFLKGSDFVAMLFISLVWMLTYILCTIKAIKINKEIQENNDKETKLILKLLLAIYAQTQKPTKTRKVKKK